MRATALAAGVAVLVGCGSSTSTPQDGGINGGLAPSGTVQGVSFTPTDGLAVPLANELCTPPGANFAALLVAFTDFPACSYLRQYGTCGDRKSSTLGLIQISRAGIAPMGLAPGTYAIGQARAGTCSPVPDATCVVTTVTVDLMKFNATCVNALSYASVTGTVTIASMSPSVTGSVAATFWSGLGGTGTNLGTWSGSFDVNACSAGLTMCGLVNGACPVPAPCN